MMPKSTRLHPLILLIEKSYRLADASLLQYIYKSVTVNRKSVEELLLSLKNSELLGL